MLEQTQKYSLNVDYGKMSLKAKVLKKITYQQKNMLHAICKDINSSESVLQQSLSIDISLVSILAYLNILRRKSCIRLLHPPPPIFFIEVTNHFI